MSLFRVLIYGIIFTVYAGSVFYDVFYMPRIGFDWWIVKLVMLSIINLVLQTIYSAICFICSIFDLNNKNLQKVKSNTLPSYWRQTKLHCICDFMYFTSIFPVGMACCLLFWIIFIINPNLIRESGVEKLIPEWYNHILHTAPIIFILIDTLLTCHHAPSCKYGTIIVALLYTIYLLIIFGVKYFNNFWLYPIFYYAKNYEIIILLVLSGIFFWFLYFLGYGLNLLLWGEAVNFAPNKTEKNSKKVE